MTRLAWRDPHCVNLTGVPVPAVFDGGYYLFSAPSNGERVGVILANRQRQLDEYRAAHPVPWRKALTEVLALAG